jgi:putative nucleotidyltransferase with HDIG domain
MPTISRPAFKEFEGTVLEQGALPHDGRVAATAAELAKKLRWSEYKKSALVEAAAHHHLPLYTETPAYWERVIRDVGSNLKPPVKTSNLNMEVEARELSRLLQLACYLSRRWEAARDEPLDWEAIQEEMDARARDGFLEERHLHLIRQRTQAAMQMIDQAVATLPVFPSIALQAMQIASDPMSAGKKLEETINSDPVLAGEILHTANSPVYSPMAPITTIRQAVLLIGCGEACRVIASSLFRPMFQAAALRPLWNHSLEVARLAESCARLSGKADPEEAFLAGLMHDVGRLAMLKTPIEVQGRIKAMHDAGCEPLYAETIVFGFDHCRAGVEVLREWQIPESIQEAVACHHSPELGDSVLASCLYLAEHWSQSMEDLPSDRRTRAAMQHVGLQSEMLKALPSAPPMLAWD